MGQQENKKTMAFELSQPSPDVAWAEDGDSSSVGFTQSVLAAVVQFVERLLLIMHILTVPLISVQ